MPKQEWQRPEVLSVNSLPDVLGDCVGGSTDLSGPGLAGSCRDGQATGATSHSCVSGGLEADGNCSTGGSVG